MLPFCMLMGAPLHLLKVMSCVVIVHVLWHRAFQSLQQVPGLVLTLFNGLYSCAASPSCSVTCRQNHHDTAILSGTVLASVLCVNLQSTQHLVVHLQAGWEGKYNSDEVYFYTLDALPIFVAFCVYSLLHFGLYLPSSSTTMASCQDQPSAASSHKGNMKSNAIWMSILGHMENTSKGGKLAQQVELV